VFTTVPTAEPSTEKHRRQVPIEVWAEHVTLERTWPFELALLINMFFITCKRGRAASDNDWSLFQWERANFAPPQRRNCDAVRHWSLSHVDQFITSVRWSELQNLVEIDFDGGVSQCGLNIQFPVLGVSSVFLFLLFRWSAYGPLFATDVYVWCLKRRGLEHGCTCCMFELILSTIGAIGGDIPWNYF